MNILAPTVLNGRANYAGLALFNSFEEVKHPERSCSVLDKVADVKSVYEPKRLSDMLV